MSGIRIGAASLLEGFYKFGLLVVLFALLLLFSSLNPNFLSPANGINLLRQTASTGIAAAGLVFVMVSGGIDISMGSTIFLSAVMVTTFAGEIGIPGAFVLAIACGALVGCFNGFLVAFFKLPPLIVTLASLYIVRGVALAMTGVQSLDFPGELGDLVAYTQIGGILPVTVVILVLCLAIVQVMLSRTLFGRQLFAMGNNRIGANQMGIKVTRNTFFVYVIAGALAGLAGLTSAAQVGVITPTFAEGQEFIIITAAILGGVSLFGGKGSAFPGAFLGVLVVMCIENGLVMAGANVYLYAIVRGAIIFVAVAIDCIRNKGELR